MLGEHFQGSPALDVLTKHTAMVAGHIKHRDQQLVRWHFLTLKENQ